MICAKISSKNILDLDKKLGMNKFLKFCEELGKEIVELGIILDFTQDDASKKLKQERMRCFYLDQMKDRENIDTIIYTFSKDNPSYKYANNSMKDMGLSYNEKQICVTKNDNISNRYEVCKHPEFDEVII